MILFKDGVLKILGIRMNKLDYPLLKVSNLAVSFDTVDGTIDAVQGINFEALTKEVERRHELGYPKDLEGKIAVLPNPGDFHWRNGGESHMWDPKTISSLQLAARTNDESAYWDFAKHANEHTTNEQVHHVLHSLFARP